MKRWLFSVGWVLLGLLGIGALLITSGQNDLIAKPVVSSYGVSGASALADLLRLRGFETVVDRHAIPKLQKGDVVIAFEPADASELSDSDQVQKSEDSIKSQIKAGGAVFWLPLKSEFESASAAAQTPVSGVRFDGKPRAISGEVKASGWETAENAVADSSVPILKTKDFSFIKAESSGAGHEISYSDGIGLTNRFLDKADNAQIFVEILKAFAPNARRVVFTESTFGDVQSPGFLETLGPWAEGGWYQFIFLAFIVVISLNQRFGLPVRLRRTQVGGRELVDALTDTLIRARATDLGLECAYDRADLRVRSVIKMPRDASEGERDRLMPPEILKSLKEVKAASTMNKVRPGDALQLVVKLEQEVDRFADAHTSVLARPKRRNR